MDRAKEPRVARRDFLKTATAAATGITIVKSKSVAGTQANSKIELGIVGSGNRGIWIGDLFHKHSQIKVTALADVFKNRLNAGCKQLDVDPSRCYQGLDAYRELVASDLDAVCIESPACFHPEQAMAAVEADRHVFLAKPIAVDVPGCRTVREAGEKARGKRTFLVDFQTRSTGLFQEAARRVHQGAIGKPVFGHIYYHTNRLSPIANPKDASSQARLRNWFFDKALSGDIIVEQNIHVLDVANWYLQSHPVKACGTGGRKARVDVGDCWDHFIVTYWYPDEVLVDFSSGQFIKGFDDLCMRVYGTTGTVDSHYAGDVAITGDKPWAGGNTKPMYEGGAVENIKAFEESIRSGKYINNADTAVDSNLTCILGRTAAYENRVVTWDEMMKSNTKLPIDLEL